MKKLLILFIAQVLYLNCFSQSDGFKIISEKLGKDSKEIIDSENTMFGDKFLDTRLFNAGISDEGELFLHYVYRVDTITNSTIYYFNKKNNCSGMVFIQDLKNRDVQIENLLANGFYRKSPYLYYHNKYNLMVNVKFDNKTVLFDYAKKPVTKL